MAGFLEDMFGRGVGRAVGRALGEVADATLNEGKKHIGVPGAGGSFDDLVSGVAEVDGGTPRWLSDELAVVTVTSRGREWKVFVHDLGDVVCLELPTNLKPSVELMQLSFKVPLGGWALVTDGNTQRVSCKMSAMRAWVNGVQLHGMAKMLAMYAEEALTKLR